MTVLSHNRGTVHSIFKICISRNMKCDKTVGFLKYSHIYYTSALAIARKNYCENPYTVDSVKV